MRRYVEGRDRQQVTLLPECLEDFIAEDNPVRVVEAFVEALDFEALGFGLLWAGRCWRSVRRCSHSGNPASRSPFASRARSSGRWIGSHSLRLEIRRDASSVRMRSIFFFALSVRPASA